MIREEMDNFCITELSSKIVQVDSLTRFINFNIHMASQHIS